MSRHTSQQSSYIEEDAYDSAYSEASRDPLDDFLDRYTVDFDPEYRLKLKKQFKNVALAASVGVGGPALLITVKPQYEDRDCCWWRRVVLNPQKQGISLYTRKFRIGNLVDLQLEAHSTSSQRLGVSWRVFPKWSKSGSSKLTYKYKANWQRSHALDGVRAGLLPRGRPQTGACVQSGCKAQGASSGSRQETGRAGVQHNR